MSLDIYLESDIEEISTCSCDHCGNEHEHKCFPILSHFNITHNLAKMADASGLYDFVWRPDENGITTAIQMIPILEEGISKLNDETEKYKEFNPSNGWGSYEGFVKVIGEYLQACKENQKAKISVCR